MGCLIAFIAAREADDGLPEEDDFHNILKAEREAALV